MRRQGGWSWKQTSFSYRSGPLAPAATARPRAADATRWLARASARASSCLHSTYGNTIPTGTAAAGATTSTSVDASATYLDWFGANLALNGFSDRQHRAVRADVRAWLAEETRQYELIMLDPPSFSNSKSHDDFDVQRDHAALLELAMARLTADGALYFSTNSRRFKLDTGVSDRWRVSDVTPQSIPEDFRRNHRIHACWRLTHS